ncbi:hypothetical protein BOTBODRAFT_31632 [Botryobasidium botryosum FD-172 SS1]|uniref:UvrD-like helicase ATP-binding domain-containing protein n=1 Tax=Botryobasidium botryosum (strain FD-172 SS1) TaxID=930990 RepID=A0A067MW11_BOTB1|nr:hypothetical protein BOTBODRAFT_31632 [Botryobasidium botryosum FD-172 SS1]
MERLSYPTLPPIAPSLFTSDTGLGHYQVLLSGHAIRHLKQYRDNSATFREILKTFRRLSKGEFSQENHQVEAGGTTHTPVYKAKLKNGMNILYQFLWSTDGDGVRQQVIRIYGIYATNKIDRPVWESIARQSAVGNKSNLSDDQLLEIHKLLTLEKFVPYSQSVIKNIWADLDSAFVFDLSEKEQEVICHPSSVCVIGRSGTGKTTTMLFRMLFREKTPNSLDRKLRQVFVTQSKVLAKHVHGYYKKLDETLEAGSKSIEEIKNLAAAKRESQEEEEDLFDLDDEDETRSDLPERYSELDDSHFPLFVTFNQLCRLLEVDILKASTPLPMFRGRRSVPQVLSFEDFVSQYWTDHLLTKDLDPAIVWSEIMGVIRGSETAVETMNGYLSESQYLKLSRRAQTTFAKYPAQVYGIFEAYMKRKKNSGVVDPAERTHDLLRAISSGYQPKHRIDFLYVDEVQDNLLIDTRLLYALCPNPHGFFWAGDTAQTISVGCTFKFSELRTSLYRLEEADDHVRAGTRAPVHPKRFELSVNYRSHAGIVDAASSVIDLLLALFPESIDKLEAEAGLADGPVPVFFAGWDNSTAGFKEFLLGKGSRDSSIEFGAHQCVIVRNAGVRDALRNKFGKMGCIMTPYETKGLEFNDVLLYNFFEDSRAGYTEWSVVLDTLRGNHVANQALHAIICSELKSLYVALTRARNNCWIWDSSESGKPMKDFWNARQKVRIVGPNDDIPKLAVESSPAEWKKTGRELFSRRLYDEAMLCFERAGCEFEKTLCKAYSLRAQARLTPDNLLNAGRRSAAFARAADTFLTCARMAPEKRRLLCHANAAECFSSAGHHDKAGDAYRDAKEFTLSAQSYRKAGSFDKCVDVVQKHRSSISDEVAESLLDVCKLVYIRENKLKKAAALVESDEVFLEVLEDYGFDTARLDVLLRLKRFAEAAKLRLRDGEVIEAIKLFLKAGDPPSHRRAALCVLDGLWRCYPLGVSRATSSTAIALFDCVKQINRQYVDLHQKAELEAFQAIAHGNVSQLRKLGYLHSHSEQPVTYNPSLALLCLDNAFSQVPALHLLDAPSITCILDEYRQYGRLLRDIVIMPDMCTKSKIQRLIGFGPAKDSDDVAIPNKYLCLESSLLRQVLRNTLLGEQGPVASAADVTVDGRTLTQVVQNYLTERLYGRVLSLQKAALEAPVLQLCLYHFVNNSCSPSCDRSHEPQDANAFNNRLQIHIQQIEILHHTGLLPCRKWVQNDLRKAQRIWLERFFDALHPAWYGLGNFHNLMPQNIPRFRDMLGSIRASIRDQLFLIDNSTLSIHYVNTILATSMLISKLDSQEAPKYMWRAPCLFIQHPALAGDLSQPGPSVIQDMFCCLQYTPQRPLHRGLWFVKRILENGACISINILLPFIEKLVAHTLIENRLRWGIHRLHNLTLPRSWFVEVFQQHFRWLNADPGCIMHVRQLLQGLLNTIFNNPDRAWLGTKELSKVSPLFKDIVITRICRTLVLIGYNTGYKVQVDIYQAITSVSHRDGNFRVPNNPFIRARDWRDMVTAMRSSISRCSMDNLVRLHDMRIPEGPPVPNTECIGFRNDFGDLCRRLAYPGGIGSTSILMPSTKSSTPLSDNRSPLAAPAASLTPAAPGTSRSVAPTEPHLQSQPQGDIPLEGDEGHDAQSEQEADEKADGDDLLLDPSTEDLAKHITDEEKAVARRLLRSFRQRHRRRTDLETSHEKPVHRHFATCMAAAAENGLGGTSRTSRAYMRLFLGPLPHLLAYLEGIRDRTLQRKDDAKKRCKKAQHAELERVMQDLNKSSTLFKAVTASIKKLEPKSALHKECSVERLRAAVVDVQRLESQVEEVLGEGALKNQDLRIGMKGIIQPHASRPTQKRPKAPTLNTEDIDW